MELLGADGRALLSILAWLSPEPIPRLLAEQLSHAEAVPSIDVESGLADLADYSLLRWQQEGDAFNVHRLVQEITRYRIPAGDRRGVLERCLQMVSDFVRGDAADVRTWNDVYNPVRDHLAVVVEHADANQVTAPTTRLMSALAADYPGKKEGHTSPKRQRGGGQPTQAPSAQRGGGHPTQAPSASAGTQAPSASAGGHATQAPSASAGEASPHKPQAPARRSPPTQAPSASAGTQAPSASAEKPSHTSPKRQRGDTSPKRQF